MGGEAVWYLLPWQQAVLSGRPHRSESVRNQSPVEAVCVRSKERGPRPHTAGLHEGRAEAAQVPDSLSPPYRPTQPECVRAGISGLTVYRYEDGRLATVSRLKSVGYTVSVAVNSSDTVFVCDWNDVTKGDSVYLVDVKADTVIKTLTDPGQDPQHPLPGEPWHVAVLGDSVLVSYGPRPPHRLVLYHSDVTHPAQELHIEGLEEEVWAVTTDTHSRFLVTCSEAVFVLDGKGNLLHQIQTDSEDLRDCAIVQSQLWLADLDARILAMTTQ